MKRGLFQEVAAGLSGARAVVLGIDAERDMRDVRRGQAHSTNEENHLFGKWTLFFTESSLDAPITHSSSRGHTHSGLHIQGFFLSGTIRQTLLHTHPTLRDSPRNTEAAPPSHVGLRHPFSPFRPEDRDSALAARSKPTLVTSLSLPVIDPASHTWLNSGPFCQCHRGAVCMKESPSRSRITGRGPTGDGERTEAGVG